MDIFDINALAAPQLSPPSQISQVEFLRLDSSRKISLNFSNFCRNTPPGVAARPRPLDVGIMTAVLQRGQQSRVPGGWVGPARHSRQNAWKHGNICGSCRRLSHVGQTDRSSGVSAESGMLATSGGQCTHIQISQKINKSISYLYQAKAHRNRLDSQNGIKTLNPANLLTNVPGV